MTTRCFYILLSSFVFLVFGQSVTHFQVIFDSSPLIVSKNELGYCL